MLTNFKIPMVLAVVVAAALLAVGSYFTVTRKPSPPPTPNPTAPGFKNIFDSSGINFRMNFLPDEQGEKYKINLYDHGSGLAVGDFDGDGYDDVYFVNQLGKNALYRNRGDGTFEDVTGRAGVALGDRICVAATFADYDNDGRQDLFVTSVRGGNVLFRNLGGGAFRDVTKEAGVQHVGHSQMPVFFDFDNDGWLDLLVTQTAHWTLDQINAKAKNFVGKDQLWNLIVSPHEPNLLYRNNRNGTFTEVGKKAGLEGLGWTADAAVFDYNDDGLLDVVLTNMFGNSQLYRNNGNGTFTDVTVETLGRTPWGGMGARAFDFNNDAKLDLFIVDMHSDMWIKPSADPAEVQADRKYTGMLGRQHEFNPDAAAQQEKDFAERGRVRYDRVLFGNALYRNLGGGRFEEMSDRARLETFWPWGIAPGDFDNDGNEDLFIPAGMGHPFFYWPNSLMMNQGDGTFANQALQQGVEPPADPHYFPFNMNNKQSTRSSRAAAVSDFDGDGRLDILTNNFNDHPYYFRNSFALRNHISFRLQGVTSNRDAIGALVTLRAGKFVRVRQVHPAGGYLSQSSRVVHFGLGERGDVDAVEIRWPSGKRQTIHRPQINKLHVLVEP